MGGFKYYSNMKGRSSINHKAKELNLAPKQCLLQYCCHSNNVTIIALLRHNWLFCIINVSCLPSHSAVMLTSQGVINRDSASVCNQNHASQRMDRYKKYRYNTALSQANTHGRLQLKHQNLRVARCTEDVLNMVQLFLYQTSSRLCPCFVEASPTVGKAVLCQKAD